MQKTVVGLFDRWADAQAAVHEIEAAGIRDRQVSILGNRTERTVSDEQVSPTGEAALEGAGTGAASGVMIGTGVGLLAGLGALVIPGIGPLFAAGPIMAGLTGAGMGAVTGAAAGGLMGALSSVGVPHHEVGYYEEGIRRGGTLVVVACEESDAPFVTEAMDRHNVVDIEQRSKRAAPESGLEDAVGSAYRYAPVELGGRLDPDEVVENDPPVAA